MNLSKFTKYLLMAIIESVAITLSLFVVSKLKTMNGFSFIHGASVFLFIHGLFAILIYFIYSIPTLDAHRSDHGTSGWEEKDAFLNNVYTWDFKETPPEGGIFVGAELDKIGKPKKAYHLFGAVHNLIIASSRSGKTRKIILETIYQIARAGESLVINDPKGELYLIISEFLRSIGYKIICLDFRSPLKSNYWNPLSIIRDFFEQDETSLAIDATWDLANILVPSTDVADDNIFEKAAQSLLAGAIIYLCVETKLSERVNMSSLRDLLIDIADQNSEVSLNNIVENLHERHPARKAWSVAYTTSGMLRASVFANAMTALRLYSDPSVESMTAKQDHIMSDVGNEKTAIFTIIPDEKSTRHNLAVTYHAQLYQVLIQTAIRYGGRLRVPVHYIYDEFGNSPVLPDMGSKITAAASRGIKFYLVLQDLQQLHQYGEHTANTILANMHNWLYISTNNPQTSKVICEKLGKTTIETKDLSFDDPFDLIPKERQSLIERELQTQDELLRWKNNHLILMPQGRKQSFHSIVDISQYQYHAEFGLEGDPEIDQRILHHRENIRPINREIEPRLFSVGSHIEALKKLVYEKHLEEKSDKEIAVLLKLPEKTVKKYIKELSGKNKKQAIEFSRESFSELLKQIKQLEEDNETLRKTAIIFSKGQKKG